jgi:hypothetical protein
MALFLNYDKLKSPSHRYLSAIWEAGGMGFEDVLGMVGAGVSCHKCYDVADNHFYPLP